MRASRAPPDDRFVIRINTRILLLHQLHRSDRRQKDRSIVVNPCSVTRVKNVDIG
jgi:hypothetical protein